MHECKPRFALMQAFAPVLSLILPKNSPGQKIERYRGGPDPTTRNEEFNEGTDSKMVVKGKLSLSPRKAG